MPSLYVISTPIGNLEDITLRALRILEQVDIVAAEDTRTTRKLLNHYHITTRLISYQEHNSANRIPIILEALINGDVAIVSDAGTPCISDPGLHLIRSAISNGFNVIPIPGPSAVITALAASGISSDNFLFIGFLPRRKTARRHILESLVSQVHTLVIFEAPHRLTAALQDLQEIFGTRHMAVMREATKFYEEVFRGSASECIDYFKNPRGEFTLVIEGNNDKHTFSIEEATSLLNSLLEQGISAKDARSKVSYEAGISKKSVYNLWLNINSHQRMNH